MLRSRFSELGASLIETMVAVGILGVIAYFIVGMLRTGTLGQKTLLAQDDARVLTTNMASLLGDPIACENTFGGVAGMPLVAPADPVTGTSIPAIVDANGKSQFVLNDVYGNKSLKLSKIMIGGSGMDAKTQISRWLPASTTPITGTAFVEVQWQPAGTGDNKSGPSILSRYFLVSVSKMSGNTILKCTAQGGGASKSFWSITDSENIYNNNQNGMGNVGIGTTNPMHKLHIASPGQDGIIIDAPINPEIKFTRSGVAKGFLAIAGAAGEYFTNSSANSLILRSEGSALHFGSAGANDITMTLAANGSVGIGTTSPDSLLHVNNTGTGPGVRPLLRLSDTAASQTLGYPYMDFGTNVGGTFTRTGFIGDGSSVEQAIQLWGDTGTSLSFGTNFAERMRIDTSGNVGIGIINPSYTLHVAGTAGLSTGTAWTNASDIRLKDLHGDYEHGLDEVLKLHTVRFTYKKDNPLGLPSDHPMTGFVAQEVEKVIPEAVHENKNGYLELNVDPIHWAVVNAVKELKKLIDDIYERLSGLDQDIAVVMAENVAKDRKIKADYEMLKQENIELKARMDRIEQKLNQSIDD